MVETDGGDNVGYQFKTHPNIDKAAYSADGTLRLKDPTRPFPTGSALGVLKWRLQVSFCSFVLKSLGRLLSLYSTSALHP